MKLTPELLEELGLHYKFKHQEDIPKDRECAFVGGPWPASAMIRGSVRAVCDACRSYISFKPHTQKQLKDRTAKTLFFCPPCARKHIERNAAQALAERANRKQ